MSSGQGNEKGFNPSYKDSFNFAYALAKGHAMCFLPFFRKNFGSEALGIPGTIAFVLMLVVGSFARIPEMLPFLGIWLVVMLYHRASTMRAVYQGVIRHSRYEGDIDTKLIKSVTIVKQVVEPLACVISGLCFETLGLSHGFALYVGLGGISLAFVVAIDRQLEYKRLEAMRDAEMEQRYLVAKYREEIK